MKIFLALLLALALYGQSITLPTTTGSNLNLNITSSTLSIQGYEGKYLIVEFFGKKCPICKQLAPTIEKLNQREDFQVIGIHMQSNISNASVNDYIAQHNLSFPVINYDQSYAPYTLAKNIDPSWQMQIPFILYIDKNSQVIGSSIGFHSYDDIVSTFKKYGSLR